MRPPLAVLAGLSRTGVELGVINAVGGLVFEESIMNRGFAAIGLFSPQDGHNIGSVLRAAGCYGGKIVLFTGKVKPKFCTDTQKIHRHLPLLNVESLRDSIPHGAVPVAVDLLPGAEPLPNYKHPERAFYIFGPENGTLGQNITSWCRDKIYIPTSHCMNLAATVNVVLYDRMSKG